MHKRQAAGAVWWSMGHLAIALGSMLWMPAGQAQLRPVAGHEYRETIDPKRPVSGHLVVGISLVDRARVALLEEAQFASRKLSVNLKGVPANAQLRVDLDSPDGKFHGTGMWLLERGAGDWAELTLLDKDQPRRPRLQGGYLAISVVAQGGGVSAPRPLLASLDSKDTLTAAGDGHEIWLQVNSRRGQMSVRGRSGTPPAKCERLASASVVRFDTLCKLPVGLLDRQADGRHQLTLIRRDGFEVETQQVDLHL
jgi:hypothetical protein